MSALDMAKTVLGQSEGQDRASLIDYMKTGGVNIDPATRAWCAAFINASLNKAGYSGTGSDMARSFLNWGEAVEPTQVQPGDIGVYPRGSDPTYGHAGIVESVDPATGTVTMISGNAGPTGAVTSSPYKLSGALGFRRAQQIDQQMQAAGYTPEQRRNAIASIESAGSGDYAATGPWTGDPEEGRDRAYGRYQVMGKNIGPWAEQYLKQSGVTPEQFIKDPALQDKLFDAVYGGYAQKYGERGAASMWFTGRPDEPAVSDVNGKLTGKTYADRYMEALGATPQVTHPPNPTVGKPDVASAAQVATDKDKWGKAFSGAATGYADLRAPVLGANGNAPQLPAQAPMAAAPMPFVAESQVDENRRNQLAQLMQSYWI
jgi:uncharacterized protein (TIGR02594 family)